MADTDFDFEPIIRNTTQDIRQIIRDISRTEEAKAFTEGYTECRGGHHERRGNGYAHFQFEIDTRRCKCEGKPTDLLPLCWSCLAMVHGHEKVRCSCKVDRPLSEVFYRGTIRAA